MDDERVAAFASMTERQLSERKLLDGGMFIAEGAKVVRVGLQAGYEPVAFLTEALHLPDIEALQETFATDAPVYVGEHAFLTCLSGYNLSRGILCAMRRKPLSLAADILEGASRVAVLDGIVEATNVGLLFRSAAALGMDAVLVTPNTCDPMNRRAMRVSMGNTMLVPWAWTSTLPFNAVLPGPLYQSYLNALGFRTVAMALTDRSIPLDDPALKSERRLAFLLGNEGDGLPDSTIKSADYTVRIPMYHGVDSLNVAAAAAIAFWELRRQPPY